MQEVYKDIETDSSIVHSAFLSKSNILSSLAIIQEVNFPESNMQQFEAIFQNYLNNDYKSVVDILMSSTVADLISSIISIDDFPFQNFIAILLHLYYLYIGSDVIQHLLEILISILSIQKVKFDENLINEIFKLTIENHNIEFKQRLKLVSYISEYSLEMNEKCLQFIDFRTFQQCVDNNDLPSIGIIIFFLGKINHSLLNNELINDILLFMHNTIIIGDNRLINSVLYFIIGLFQIPNFVNIIVEHQIIQVIDRILVNENLDQLEQITSIYLMISKQISLPDFIIKSLIGCISRMETADSSMNVFFTNVAKIFQKNVLKYNDIEIQAEILMSMIVLIQDGSYFVKLAAIKTICNFILNIEISTLQMVIDTEFIQYLADFIDETQPKICKLVCKSLEHIYDISLTCNMDDVVLSIMYGAHVDENILDLEEIQNFEVSTLYEVFLSRIQ